MNHILSSAFILSFLFNMNIVLSLTWEGLDWTIKSGSGLGPGPNTWLSDNVFVDTNGYLHLKITYNASGTEEWECAELYTDDPLPFGTYQWWVVSDLDFDPNVVLGLFFYEGPDGTNEIDIEFSKFGDTSPLATNADYCVYPKNVNESPTCYDWDVTLSGTFTTQRFEWAKKKVEFWTIGGHHDITSETNIIQNWLFQPSGRSWRRLIPQDDMRMHMNLWLFQGNAPIDGNTVEVVIRAFDYVN